MKLNTIKNTYAITRCDNTFTLYFSYFFRFKLAHLSEISDEELLPDYKAQVLELKETITSSLSPKKINETHYFTGKDFVSFLRYLITVINSHQMNQSPILQRLGLHGSRYLFFATLY